MIWPKTGVINKPSILYIDTNYFSNRISKQADKNLQNSKKKQHHTHTVATFLIIDHYRNFKDDNVLDGKYFIIYSPVIQIGGYE